MFCVVVPTVSSVISLPSTSIRATRSPTDGDSGESVLGRIEVAPVLDLYSWLQLSCIQKISTIDRQLINLLRGDDSLHCGLFGVDTNFGRAHFDHLRFLSK